MPVKTIYYKYLHTSTQMNNISFFLLRILVAQPNGCMIAPWLTSGLIRGPSPESCPLTFSFDSGPTKPYLLFVIGSGFVTYKVFSSLNIIQSSRLL